MIRSTKPVKMAENRKLPDQMFVRALVTIDPESDLFMQVAQKAYREHEASLIPCSKCGRKFFPDRIRIHESACKENSSKPAIKQSTVNTKTIKNAIKPPLANKGAAAKSATSSKTPGNQR